MGKLVLNSLLFYLVNKSKTHARDKIAEICSKFYNSEEILEAKRILSESCGKIVVNRQLRRDENFLKTLTDMCELIISLDNSNEDSPTFVISDLSRIPLNDDENVSLNQVMCAVNSLSRQFVDLKKSCVTRDMIPGATKDMIPSLSAGAAASAERDGSLRMDDVASATSASTGTSNRRRCESGVGDCC